MSGYEPRRIPGGGEHTDSWDHPDIKDAFSPLDTTDAINQAEKYWQVHQLWEQGVDTFARSIQKSIAQAWSGPAAEKSKESIQNYTNEAHNLSPALAELHLRVRDAATAIVNTKKAIPDPVDVPWYSWAAPVARWSLSRERSEEQQKAREAMNEHYVQPFSQMDSKIPVLPTPSSPTKGVDIPAPPPGGYQTEDSNGPGGQPSQPNSPGTTPDSTTPSTPGDKDGDGKPDDQATTDQSTDQSTTEQTTPSSTTPSSTQTTPTSTNPTTQSPGTPTTDPTKTVPTGTGTPTTPGTPGRPGTPSSPGSPGSPKSTTPQPGRSIPGMPTAPGTPVSPAAAAAAAAARGAAGAPGVGGAPMGARGGKSDDEAEHKIPEYLITQENTDELLGDIPPTLPGGVIGGDIPT